MAGYSPERWTRTTTEESQLRREVRRIAGENGAHFRYDQETNLIAFLEKGAAWAIDGDDRPDTQELVIVDFRQSEPPSLESVRFDLRGTALANGVIHDHNEENNIIIMRKLVRNGTVTDEGGEINE